MLETKEVGVVKAQATRLVTAANALEIKDQLTLEEATDILSKVKTVGKEIKARKEEITKPLMESLNSVRDLFKPIEASHADAERIIKGKMIAYQNEREAERDAEVAKLAARVEKGTMKHETAIAKMETIGETQTTAQGKVGFISTRTIKKVRIIDETQIPRQYLVPNMVLINEAVLKGGVVIPGVEAYEEKIISAR